MKFQASTFFFFFFHEYIKMMVPEEMMQITLTLIHQSAKSVTHYSFCRFRIRFIKTSDTIVQKTLNTSLSLLQLKNGFVPAFDHAYSNKNWLLRKKHNNTATVYMNQMWKAHLMRAFLFALLQPFGWESGSSLKSSCRCVMPGVFPNGLML